MSSSARDWQDAVGVIDVGSNTIKLLIARLESRHELKVLDLVVEDTRIGEGISGRPPRLDDDAIQRGSEAIERLNAKAEGLGTVSIVATSAVRDAENKAAFVNEVEKRCGRELRVLSGEEEARLIGIGLRYDPALRDLSSFSLMDLGGGSLECIQFDGQDPAEAESLQLGSVRLASMLLKDRSQPLSETDESRIRGYVKERFAASRFKPGSSPSEVAVLTGGAASHLGELIGNERRQAGLSLDDFCKLKERICSATEEARVSEIGIPRSRADIFPTAMVTLETALRYLGCSQTRFSHYNLRYGVAAVLLEHGALRL